MWYQLLLRSTLFFSSMTDGCVLTTVLITPSPHEDRMATSLENLFSLTAKSLAPQPSFLPSLLSTLLSISPATTLPAPPCHHLLADMKFFYCIGAAALNRQYFIGNARSSPVTFIAKTPHHRRYRLWATLGWSPSTFPMLPPRPFLRIAGRFKEPPQLHPPPLPGSSLSSSMARHQAQSSLSAFSSQPCYYPFQLFIPSTTMYLSL